MPAAGPGVGVVAGGTGVAVESATVAGVAVGDRVAVGVGDGVAVGVGEGVGVGVLVGVGVFVGSGVAVGSGSSPHAVSKREVKRRAQARIVILKERGSGMIVAIEA